MSQLLVFAYSISAKPQPGSIDKPLQTLLNLSLATGLLLCALGFVTGVSMRAIGTHTVNIELARRGHSMFMWSAACAALLAGATAIINYFWGLGLLI